MHSTLASVRYAELCMDILEKINLKHDYKSPKLLVDNVFVNIFPKDKSRGFQNTCILKYTHNIYIEMHT